MLHLNRSKLNDSIVFIYEEYSVPGWRQNKEFDNQLRRYKVLFQNKSKFTDVIVFIYEGYKVSCWSVKGKK